MSGYSGMILRVNLSKGESVDEPLDDAAARMFIGGRGLAAKILFDELKPGIDPLGPENKLVFATGVLTGIPVAGSSRHVTAAKSPLTGIWGESQGAGEFGPQLKYAGYDAIIVEGVADKPVYLWIRDGKTEIRDGEHLWGKFTKDVRGIVQKEVKEDRASVAFIGPGGENIVKYACIMFDLAHATGRTGMGAVMGSKKLKAVAVRGTRPLKYANEERAEELLMSDHLKKSAITGAAWVEGESMLQKHGTAMDVLGWQATGRLPTMNFKKCTFDGAEKIAGEAMTAGILIRRNTCPYCPIACNRIVEVHYPYDVDPEYGGPEYETIAALGSFCMNESLAAISKANELCNKYGIDTISTGVSIAFAMECFEHGLITKKDIGGLDLTWGNPEAIVQLTEKIGKREGIGDLLAEGVRAASKKIGGDAEYYAMHVKGLEIPMHEARGKKGHGFGYAISTRGACHLQMESDDLFEGRVAMDIGVDERLAALTRLDAGPEKATLAKVGNDWYTLCDNLLICKFSVYPTAEDRMRLLTEIVAAATGWDLTIDEMKMVAQRTATLERAFGVREGISREDDVLPRRLMEEPLPDGPYKGETFSKETLDVMLDQYYKLRGWGKETGIPTEETLAKLGLGYVADQLKAMGRLPA